MMRIVRKLLGLLLLIAFYVVVLALAVEGFLRLFHATPPDAPVGFFWRQPVPTTGWSLEPGAHGRWYNPMYEYDQEITINSRGLRSPEAIGYDKPAGVFRILVLGDSYVEALQVALEESFPQQLAAALNAAGAGHNGQPVRVEAINAGVSGWGTDQQLLWLREEGYKYQPDLILLAFFPGNDFMNNYLPLEFANFGAVRKPWFALEDGALVLHDYPFDPEAARATARQLRAQRPVSTEDGVAASAERPLAAWGAWLHEHSALHRFLDPRLRAAAPGLAAQLARWGVLDPGQESSDQAQGEGYIPVAYGVYAQPTTAEWESAFAVTGAIFAELRAEADRLGVPLRAVLVTAPEQVDPARWPRILQQYPAMQAQSWSLTQPAAIASQLLTAAGIPVLDLAPDFMTATAEGARLHFAHDGHWTPAGQRQAAVMTGAWLSADPALLSVQQPLSTPVHRNGWHLFWRGLGIAVLALLLISLLWSIYKNGPVAWWRKVSLNLGTAGELLTFTVRRGEVLLLPLVMVLLLFGGLLIIAQASVVGPFIYTLF
ncbi:MAG TPA: hypothetical protein GYA08_07335 [Chloroflexi bacterium]|nr:hypothetical protein [Chloroflexota bacterium]